MNGLLSFQVFGSSLRKGQELLLLQQRFFFYTALVRPLAPKCWILHLQIQKFIPASYHWTAFTGGATPSRNPLHGRPPVLRNLRVPGSCYTADCPPPSCPPKFQTQIAAAATNSRSPKKIYSEICSYPLWKYIIGHMNKIVSLFSRSVNAECVNTRARHRRWQSLFNNAEQLLIRHMTWTGVRQSINCYVRWLWIHY